MTSDSGSLSIDFLVGFTIFIISFIWVVSMIPGLLVGLQSYTIDYDAVAYRTGVILVEDPGEPALPQVPWEVSNKMDVVRFGLAISRETPNILSQDKVNRFFCSTVFSYPDDYKIRAIFGDYPYRFNISLWEVTENRPPLYVGDSMSGSYGTIRRLVQLKGISNTTINATGYMSGTNETQHEFTILINNTGLLEGAVRNPAYQINPAREPILINITNLRSTMYPDRQNCFDIRLTKIYAEDENLIPIHLFNDPVIDGVPYTGIDTEANYMTELPFVNDNVSLVLDPTFLPWSNYPRVYFNLTFNLVQNNTACGTTIFSGPDPIIGSRFFNNTFTYPFDYNYTNPNVTKPSLRDAVVEVNVGSGYRTQTGTLIEQLIAEFEYTLDGGTNVAFNDLSTGSPVEWLWDFGDGNTSTLNSPIHTFPAQGTYQVRLTVTDNDGNSNGPVTHTVNILAPVAAFSGAPLFGPAPLTVVFADGSTNTPTSWKWEYNETSGGGWIQFSPVKNPAYSFPAGTYDIRLTATNAVGSNTMTHYGYITAIPLPVADFTPESTVSGVIPFSVTFTDTTINPTSWMWDFGDGNTSTLQNPVHIYEFPGTFDVSLTATNTAGSNTLTRSGIVIVTAVPMTHTITASAGSGGSILPSGAVSVNHGGSQTFTITPNPGYHILDVVVNGTYSQGPLSSYTFNNVIADHTISATFAANTPIVLFSDNFNAAFSGWTSGGNPGFPDWYAGACKNGSHSVQLIQTERITRSISTVGYSNIVVSCALGANNLESGETVRAQYSTDGGANWVMWEDINDSEDNSVLHNFANIALPASADNNANFMIRFRIYGSGTGDYGYIDDVLVRGTHI